MDHLGSTSYKVNDFLDEKVNEVSGTEICVSSIEQDAIRDGLRAVKNTLEDESVVLGAGAFEVAARQHLLNEMKKTVQGGITGYSAGLQHGSIKGSLWNLNSQLKFETWKHKGQLMLLKGISPFLSHISICKHIEYTFS